MNIFKGIIHGIRDMGFSFEKKPDQLVQKVQKYSNSVLLMYKELRDPNISPSEAALKRVLLAMKIKNQTKK